MPAVTNDWSDTRLSGRQGRVGARLRTISTVAPASAGSSRISGDHAAGAVSYRRRRVRRPARHARWSRGHARRKVDKHLAALRENGLDPAQFIDCGTKCKKAPPTIARSTRAATGSLTRMFRRHRSSSPSASELRYDAGNRAPVGTPNDILRKLEPVQTVLDHLTSPSSFAERGWGVQLAVVAPTRSRSTFQLTPGC